MSYGTIDTVLSRLKSARPAGAGKWEAYCPVHENPSSGHNRSLSVAEGQDGRVLLHCHAGCSPEDIVGALGLTMADLFPPRADGSGAVPAPVASAKSAESDKRVVATYPYRNAEGIPLFEVVRFEPKDFRRRRPDGKGAWVWNLDGVPRPMPLYRLPELLVADPAGWVFVVEGEKDADNLASIGILATSNSGGAGKWGKADGSPLAGRRVAIIADKDAVGRKHAQEVAAALHGRAAAVRVLELPGEKVKDASDWLESLDCREPEGLRQALLDMAEAAPEWQPPDPNAPESWPDPEPLDGGDEPPGIELDSCLAPIPELRDYLAAVAESYQVDPAMPAMLALSALSLAVSKAAEVQLGPDWLQPAPVWSCLIAEPGERKSAIFSEVTRPISEYEKARNEALACQLARYESDRRLLERRGQEAESKAARKGDINAAQEAREVAAELALLEPLRPPRLVAQDATTESVIELANRNGGRLGIFDAESSALENALGRYQDRPNLDFYLKAHEGDAYAFTRRKGDDFSLDRPALVMAMCVQPHAAASLLENGAAIGRGLFARFLYARPRSLKGQRNLEPVPVPGHLRQWWSETLRRILALPYPGEVFSPDGLNVERRQCEPRVLGLSPEAAEAFLALRQVLERELAPNDGRLADTRGWAEKFPAAVGRIALCLELARNSDAAEVSPEVMTAAIAWAEFLIPAFRYVVASADLDPDHRQAARVLGWVQREHLTVFSHREMHRKLRVKGYAKAEDWEPVAILLTERGYLRSAPSEETGGRPSKRYFVSPKVSRDYQN